MVTPLVTHPQSSMKRSTRTHPESATPRRQWLVDPPRASSTLPGVLGALLLTLAATPELPFEPAGTRVLAAGQTYDVTAAASPTTPVSLVVWTAMGRMGVDVSSIYAARVEPGGIVDDPEGLLISEPFGRDPSVAWLPSLNAWVVAWEFDGVTFVRVVQLDGSFHPGTIAPVNLGEGRAPQLLAANGGYFVTAEASSPRVRWVQPPALVSAERTLATPPLRYATPVRGFNFAPPGPNLMTTWVDGATLWTQMVTGMSGTLAVLPAVGRSVPPLRVDLDGVVGTAAGRGYALYRVSDGGISSLYVTRLDDPNPTPLSLDAGAFVTDNAALAELADGTFVVTSTQVDGRGLGWWLFTDGGFVGLGTVANGTSRVAVSAFGPPVGGALLLSATYNDGVVAQPVSSSLVPTGAPAQLSQSRAGHRFSQVAPWRGGAIAVWQRLTTLDATHVVWRVLPDGGHAAAPDLELAASRLDSPSVTAQNGGVALLSGGSLHLLDSAGAWAPPRTLPRPLTTGQVTTDRIGRVVVVGMQQQLGDEEAWALRLEASGAFTERLLFPLASPKPNRPRLALSRDGGFGLAVINPAQEVWATRLTSDLGARDDGGFRVSGRTSVDPFVVSDEVGGFLVVYTDGFNVLVRRVVDAAAGAETLLLGGDWDVGSVLEVPGGAVVSATSRANGELVTLFLTVDGSGSVTSSTQPIIGAGTPTNSAGLAIGEDSLTWVFGRHEADAGAATSRSVTASRAAGAPCQSGWQCVSGVCSGLGICRPVPVPTDGGLIVDAGASVDGGSVDAGSADAGSVDAGAVDAGAVDAGASLDSGVTMDAGEPADAGVEDAGVQLDAGVEDAGALDAAVVSDAGVMDAGAADAGGARRGEASYRAGCDCQSGSGPWLISAVMVMVIARRRRRL